jgi:PAS domain S-box-containing protein
MSTDRSLGPKVLRTKASWQPQRPLRLAIALVVGFAILAPIAGKPLPQANGFIPALDAAIFVTDLITGGLFLSHFSATRSRAILALGCGYLFTALIVAAHGLSFPETLAPAADLSGALRVNFRIYVLWHLGLPGTLFAYLWFGSEDHRRAHAPAPTAVVAVAGAAGAVALAICLVWLAAAGDDIFPFPLNRLDRTSPAAPWLTGAVGLMCIVALLSLWARRRSDLDRWLMVAALASVVELGITALLGGMAPVRFTVGFYAGRVFFSLLSSTVVLIVLLFETTKLFADAAKTNLLASIVSASQALSSEIELSKLSQRLIKISLEYSGAERGLLLLPSAGGLLTQAEARRQGDRIEVTVLHEAVTGTFEYSEAVVRRAISTGEAVKLDDKLSAKTLFAEDPYLRLHEPRSVLCLPLLRHGGLRGLLYLEDRLVSQRFPPDRMAVLDLLASQAAISLENARLYADLQERGARLRRLFNANIIGVFTWSLDGLILDANDAFLRIVGYSKADLAVGSVGWKNLMPSEWDPANDSVMAELLATRVVSPFEGEYVRKDGERVPVLIGAALFDGAPTEGVAFVLDLTDRNRAESAARDSERRYHEMHLRQVEMSLEARVNERTRIARELHDTLLQGVQGLVLRLQTAHTLLPSAEGRRILEESIELASDAVTESRDAVQGLRDTAIETRDLAEIMKALGEAVAAEFANSEVRFTVQVGGRPRGLLPSVRDDVLRIVGEAMRNAFQHAAPTRVEVEVLYDDDRLRVRTVDDGKGMSSDLVRRGREGHFGLRGMRERAELIGGEITLWSRDGAGTAVDFILPASHAYVASPND